MKHSAMRYLTCLTTAALTSLLIGCFPMTPDLVGGLALESSDLAAGVYWIEYSESELAMYRMPRVGGDPGESIIYEDTDPPLWYVEPALYVLDENGTWQQDSFGEGQTLDEWLQLWDPAPAIPDAD